MKLELQGSGLRGVNGVFSRFLILFPCGEVGSRQGAINSLAITLIAFNTLASYLGV